MMKNQLRFFRPRGWCWSLPSQSSFLYTVYSISFSVCCQSSRGHVFNSIPLFCGILHHIFFCFLGGLLMSPVSPFKNNKTNPALTDRNDLCDPFLYLTQWVSLGPNRANSHGASDSLASVLGSSRRFYRVRTRSLSCLNSSVNFKMIIKLAIISRKFLFFREPNFPTGTLVQLFP